MALARWGAINNFDYYYYKYDCLNFVTDVSVTPGICHRNVSMIRDIDHGDMFMIQCLRYWVLHDHSGVSVIQGVDHSGVSVIQGVDHSGVYVMQGVDHSDVSIIQGVVTVVCL